MLTEVIGSSKDFIVTVNEITPDWLNRNRGCLFIKSTLKEVVWLGRYSEYIYSYKSEKE